MKNSKPVCTPMSTDKLHRADRGYQATDKDKHQYAKAIGSLMYLTMGTRPDLAYSVSCLSRFMANPTNQHTTAIKRVLRYLKGSSNLELTYRGDLGRLIGYTDADWGADQETRRSTSGYVFSLGSAPISWSSKIQPTVALSSCEAEYTGETQATKKAIWLRRLLGELLSHQSCQ